MTTVKITDDSFSADVLGASKPVLVDFWAEWCGPCRMIGPIFEKLSEEMTDVKFVKLNVDENQESAGKFGVMSIPTMIVFKDGEALERIVGAMPKEMLQENIKKILG